MKKFLTTAVAAFMMAGTSVAAEVNACAVVDKPSVSVQQQQNVAEKMIALLKSYTKKINATKSIEELQSVVEEFAAAAEKFEKENAVAIAEFEKTATEAQKAKYEKELMQVLKAMEQATTNKAMEFAY